MKNVTSVKTNFGRFAYALETTIGDEVNDGTTKLVIGEALPNLGFRAVGSEVEKALVAAKVQRLAYVSKTGSFTAGVFTKDDPRGTVPYTLDTSKIIAEAAQKKLDEVCKKEDYPSISFLPLGEHVFGEKSDKPTVGATEMWLKVQQEKDPVKFAGKLALLGLSEDYTDESGILACKEFIKKTLEAAKAKMNAELELA